MTSLNRPTEALADESRDPHMTSTKENTTSASEIEPGGEALSQRVDVDPVFDLGTPVRRPLDDPPSGDPALTGAKAASSALARRAGLPTLPGMVLTTVGASMLSPPARRHARSTTRRSNGASGRGPWRRVRHCSPLSLDHRVGRRLHEGAGFSCPSSLDRVPSRYCRVLCPGPLHEWRPS